MSPSELSPEIKYRLLLEISQKISVTLDLGEVLSHLVDTVRSFVPYDAAGIFILNLDELPASQGRKTTNVIGGMALRGFPGRLPDSDPMLRSGKGIVGWVIGNGQTLVVPDVRLDSRYVEGRPDTLSEVAVPIMINRRVVGALNLESNRLAAFTEDDAQLLQFFASAAAISIEKAILHEQLLEKRRIESQLEIEDRSGEEFGPERLERLLRRWTDSPAEEMIRAVVRATRRFSGTEAYPDDLTLVIVKRTSS